MLEFKNSTSCKQRQNHELLKYKNIKFMFVQCGSVAESHPFNNVRVESMRACFITTSQNAELETPEILKWCARVQQSNSFENWMTDLPDILKRVPITQLAIPGTHDSMSFGISKGSGISPDSTNFVKALGLVLGKLMKPILFKWCVTQRHSAAEQLSAGIRYLDLRIAIHRPTGKFRFVHGMFAEEITSSLEEIRDFLCTHKGEIVVLDMQHFYDFKARHHHQLQTLLKNIFGSMLCPAPEDNSLSSITLSWLTKQEHQVIVLYRNTAGQCNQSLWPSSLWPTPWPETTSTDTLIEFLQNGLQERPSNAGYVTQCVLTPDSWFVVRHIFSSLQSKCAIPCNHAVIPWLKKQVPGQKGVNVVIIDYFDINSVKSPYVKTVVLLNRKLFAL